MSDSGAKSLLLTQYLTRERNSYCYYLCRILRMWGIKSFDKYFLTHNLTKDNWRQVFNTIKKMAQDHCFHEMKKRFLSSRWKANLDLDSLRPGVQSILVSDAVSRQESLGACQILKLLGGCFITDTLHQKDAVCVICRGGSDSLMHCLNCEKNRMLRKMKFKWQQMLPAENGLRRESVCSYDFNAFLLQPFANNNKHAISLDDPNAIEILSFTRVLVYHAANFRRIQRLRIFRKSVKTNQNRLQVIDGEIVQSPFTNFGQKRARMPKKLVKQPKNYLML